MTSLQNRKHVKQSFTVVPWAWTAEEGDWNTDFSMRPWLCFAGWVSHENSWKVWAATVAGEQLRCGQRAYPPAPQEHPQKPVLDNLETLRPAGLLRSFMATWQRRQACWLLYLEAGSAWVLFCSHWLSAKSARTFYMSYRYFLHPHDALRGGCLSRELRFKEVSWVEQHIVESGLESASIWIPNWYISHY